MEYSDQHVGKVFQSTHDCTEYLSPDIWSSLAQTILHAYLKTVKSI